MLKTVSEKQQALDGGGAALACGVAGGWPDAQLRLFDVWTCRGVGVLGVWVDLGGGEVAALDATDKAAYYCMGELLLGGVEVPRSVLLLVADDCVGFLNAAGFAATARESVVLRWLAEKGPRGWCESDS